MLRKKKTYKRSDEFKRSNLIYEGDASIAEIENKLWKTREYIIAGNKAKALSEVTSVWITLQELSKSVRDKMYALKHGEEDISVLVKNITEQMLTIRKGGKYEYSEYVTKAIENTNHKKLTSKEEAIKRRLNANLPPAVRKREGDIF